MLLRTTNRVPELADIPAFMPVRDDTLRRIERRFERRSLDANDVSLAYHDVDGVIASQHYAFLITEDEFDDVFGRIQARGLDYWADPALAEPGEINHNDGGRGVYWFDPDGHLLEVITRPYGSGA